MKIAFILFANDQVLRKHFSVSDVAMVPKEIREKHGSDFKFFTNPPHLTADEFCVKTSAENPDFAIVLLAEQRLSYSLDGLGLPLSVLQTDERAIGIEFSRVLTFWIKRLNAVEQILKPMGNKKALLLPFKNFKDETAGAIWSSIALNLSERAFGLTGELTRLVTHLRSREFPKRRGGDYKDKYFVDEKGHHFQYGHEVHSKPVTEGGGHTAKCAISSQLRLGLPYDRERHFNLSLENNSNLKGRAFVNCHDGDQTAESCDHINIFPNNFIN
ncbi:hypothetical protein [Ensifer sp. Root558]|uniref:hypothetical protein n=1 Tax=Ensifer sp. Root558 TaxID=1736558 RepID=UPI000714F4A2|nr:hypothetical protein [Ensifer sp. Root558]KQZ45984.1 hypothetical protein ASD63_12840 [Ensifer sp. Root558]